VATECTLLPALEGGDSVVGGLCNSPPAFVPQSLPRGQELRRTADCFFECFVSKIGFGVRALHDVIPDEEKSVSRDASIS
jgi:hypothetical protein